VFYDFNHPENIPIEHHHKYDFFVIDPPFITHEVWAKYIEAVQLLQTSEYKLLFTTIDENAQFLFEKIKVIKRTYKPSIPHLVYQYSFYSNYDDEELCNKNPEIIE